MVKFVSLALQFCLFIMIASCVQKQEGSSFGTLGRVKDGEITFSYPSGTSSTVLINELLVVNPTNLSVVNGIISNCRVKPGTTPLPAGFFINPLTCQISGSSSTPIASRSITVEVSSNKGSSFSASLTLRVKGIYSFTGTVTGLTAGQSVTIGHGVGSSVTVSSNGSYSLQSLNDEDSFMMTTTSSDPSVFTCSAAMSSGIVSANVSNAVQCYPAGNRTLSFSVSGLGSGYYVNVNTVFRDSSNTNIIDTQSLTNVGNGTFTFNAVPVNSHFTFSIASISAGYNCVLTPSATTQLTTNINDISISCGVLGPYPINLNVSGINTGTISITNNSTDSISNKTNGTYSIGAGLNYGQTYSLVFTSTPTEHDCSFSSSSGTVVGDTNINVTCAPRGKTLGGSFSGIDLSESVQIEVSSLNGTNSKTLTGVTGGVNTSFIFDTSLQYGQSYNVKILNQPNNKICTIANGSGQILGNVNAVSISCTPRAIGDCSFGQVLPWSPNAAVHAMACDGQYLYLGGDFSSFGPTIRGAALIATNMSSPIPDSRMPDLTGASKVKSDGSGGWYVKVGAGIKHLKADLSEDSSFHYGVGSSTILDFVIDGDYLFVSTYKSGRYLEKRNRFTGLDVPDFIKPIMNFYPDKIQVYERHIYIIGHFSSINSVSKLGIARFDKITGTLDSSFTATLSTDAAQTLAPNSVYSLEIFDDKIYVSGNFSYVNGTARSQFARLNLDGSLDSFNPSPNGYIDSIKKVGDYFFLGGHFSSISGQGSLSGLVKYKRSDDSLTSTGLTVSGYVNSLDYDSTNNLLLVGGGFLTAIDLNGVSRKYLGSYDLTTNRWTSFAPNLNRDVDSLSYYAGKIFAVGDFSQVYSSPINNLARLKLSDGTLDTSFTPNIGGSVSSMIYDSGENSILLGGLFTSAFTQDSYLTKIDLGTFNKKAGFVHGAFNGSISKLHRKNNNIYAIGSFTTFNSSSMKYLAKFDFLTGAKDGSFIDSEANNQILDISSDNDSLFIGGNFTSIERNSTDAKYIAALDFNGNLKTNFFNHYPLSSYSFMHYFNNVLYVKASYDYDSNGSSEYGAKFDLTSNTGTHDSSYPLNFASSSSMVILPDSSAYILYDGNIDSINLATGAQSTYLNLSYSLSGKLFGVNNNLLFVDQNTYRLFPVK